MMESRLATESGFPLFIGAMFGFVATVFASMEDIRGAILELLQDFQQKNALRVGWLFAFILALIAARATNKLFAWSSVILLGVAPFFDWMELIPRTKFRSTPLIIVVELALSLLLSLLIEVFR